MVIDFISENWIYGEKPTPRFDQQYFSVGIDETENSLDLMISLYSGFILKYCKKYLRKDGILLVNNSHGDAALPFLDHDYKLIGAVKRNGAAFSLHTKELHSCFKTKSKKPIDKDSIEKTMRGSAYAYVFRKIC